MSKQVSVDTLRKLVEDMVAMGNKSVKFNDNVTIEIKQYLPIENKRILIELVIKNSFIKDDRGIDRFDATIKEVLLNFFIARDYTNLNTMNDPFEMYDVLKSTGLMDFIKSNIPESELIQLQEMVEERIYEEYRLQKLNVNIGHKIEGILEILNRKLAEGINTMKGFNPTEQLGILTEFLDEEQKSKLQEVQDNKGDKTINTSTEINDELNKLMDVVDKQ